MSLNQTNSDWEALGKEEPLWAILNEKDHSEQWEDDEFFERGREEIESAFEYLRGKNVDLTRGSALDFGCGAGRLSQALSEYFKEVHGIDAASSMVELANSYNRYVDKCKYHVNKKNNLKIFDDNSFDFIYSNIVLQHIEPKHSKEYIKEFMRILKVGGIALFQITSHPTKIKKDSLFTKIKRFLPAKLIHFYNKKRFGRSAFISVYGVKRYDIEKIVKQNGAKLLDVVENSAAGPDWISHQYLVTK